MRSWTWEPPPPSSHPRLAAARDVAIIAVCLAILAFALLALAGPSREVPPSRQVAPAARVDV
jgi:hypothetical protein